MAVKLYMLFYIYIYIYIYLQRLNTFVLLLFTKLEIRGGRGPEGEEIRTGDMEKM
jgi:hypothetical protein